MNKFAIALSLAGALMLHSAAQAGAQSTVNVSVTSYSAIGSLHTARTSADSNQSIGCAVYGTTQSSSITYVACSATDSAGNSFYCGQYSPPAQMVQAVLAINESSVLIINSDSSYHCSYIYAYEGSSYL
jgi:hypothetical protein